MIENFLNGDMTAGLTEMLAGFIPGFLRFLSAIFIILIGMFISKLVAKFVKKALSKIGIDRLGAQLNEIEVVQKLNTDIKISAIFSKIVYYFLLFIFIIAATDVLNMSAISELIMGALNMIPKILVGLVILIFGTLFAEVIRKVLQAALDSLAIPSAKLISSFLFYFLFINVVILAIAQAEINTAFLEQNLSIVIGGIVLAFSIGYGLASKDVVANFLGSLYTEGKFKEGDLVTVGDDTGTVKEVTRNTVILSVDNKEIVYPLGLIMKRKIILHNRD